MTENSPERWCVVTGGRGFAARHLVDMLIRHQIFHVRIADLGPDIQLEPEEEDGGLGQALRSDRARYVSMDLCNKAQVFQGFQGAEVVFHMAAPDSSINNYQLHHSVNVVGTKNVIDACIELKVKRLIYTSSPSVVSDGKQGIFNGDESLPYPEEHNDSYSATKAEGEALVIKSNGKNGLLTCSIRPSSIFGPGDRLLVPSLVSAARAGTSKFVIGDGNNLYDFTYVENVAHAHVCAERALASGGTAAEKAAGQAYFITNAEPIEFWEFISVILIGLGYTRPTIKIPVAALMPIAHMVERAYTYFGPYGMKVPQMTPSRIRLVSQSRTFNCSKANDRLGYTPIVPLEEGLRRTIDAYKHLSSGVRSKMFVPSKASKLLGNGKVADALLWRDQNMTLAWMISMAAFYFYILAPGYTIVTAVSKLLLMATVLFFINDKLPVKLFGCRVRDIPETKFFVSEGMSHRVAHSAYIWWNSAGTRVQTIYKGNWEYKLCLKVVLLMLLIRLLVAISVHDLLVIVLLATVSLAIYEKNEEGMDNYVLTICFCLSMFLLLNYFIFQVFFTLFVRDKRIR